MINLNPDNMTSTIEQVRESQVHFNITSFLKPPKCADCLQVIINGWDPVKRIFNVTLRIKNPTTLTGYDVKAIMSNYDTKEFLDPDAYCDFYSGTSWQPYYLFAYDQPNHAFAPSAIHERQFSVYFPIGASPNVTITIDASWPSPQEEPWRIDNIIVSGPLQNDFLHYIAFTCHVRDLGDNVSSVIADLSPLGGPSNYTMGDNGKHEDYITGDDIWGADDIVTSAAPGFYDIWIRALSEGSTHYTSQKFTLEVIPPVPEKTPLYIVSMMHAEEQPFFLQRDVYLPFAQNLKTLKQVFNEHGAKIALQPDWTFIQGTVNFSPTLFAEFQADGHGVDTHAHESVNDLAAVHDMLDAAGVTGTIIANGGYTQDWNPDLTWAAYVAHFVDGDGNQMFLAANAYKWPPTQEVDSLFTPIRPSFTGDWMVHDPSSPIVYIPGAPANCKAIENDLNLLPAALDHALKGVVPGRINCFYWHDSVHNYGGPPSQQRIDLWKTLLTNYFDPKVASGDLVWKNFSEMYQIYLDWEKEH